MFQGKKILLAITGSIAAYKSILIIRLLIKAGAEVRVVLTPSAKDFVTPLTLSTLSKHPVISELFTEEAWSNHVMLGRWADVMLIAPLSCNTLAKMATGQCDNIVLATYLSATCPVVVAPAMDEDMWHHPTTRENLARLESFGNKVIPVDKGELASGLHGDGRMAEPEAILQYLQDHLFQRQDLEGQRALVTAGPTYEPLDPVRFIGNHSSGKMGIAIAEELARRGAEVHLVLGPSSYTTTAKGIHIQRVQTAEEMYQACTMYWPSASLAVMSAAVADYSPTSLSQEKIKKTEDNFTLELSKTKDILASLGASKHNGQVLVGFALENRNEKAYAQSKLQKKNADMIVLNSLNDNGAGFGFDTNKVTIFEKDGNEIPYERKPKKEVARDIVDRIVKMLYA
ncbi:bifunctional phosphopantothenoylcysteine decarboxylase/phosphopantothenate--cysteine ligase CoaBC [Pseudobacter ginsenosidimutans]|uniref:Coenzyme A biosynthesis bifunctional protein CoaBC n=1 Tax=Pseudobacter ginsenosidimutans TaxID=661488 RepID=A0A4Q7MKR5_9BACT|nr:bifunctional phosphopantothenoylcysteine decarboxylase/phosphopantothenate--cysteine ligase CoaBC [Pseudobacter ginsenosidimutans]QEC40503.1 bifunctional phosphopantothenoylcysteine decarboxylase/phosphopantothenate--cysteine ligase CoaBC [Pseudobacter ginsenosidimutans]RZS68886.1 phosphopantothenoylcysteine decarboxylase/phosphopantothenate--cysteine ligase [Pseudobacter ginsenosidimutans]